MKAHLAQTARTLETSLAAHSPSREVADSESRRNAVRALPTGINRIVAIGVDEFARRQPRAASRTLAGLAQVVSGVSYIGNGAQASVYRHDNQVLKVYRDSVLMSEAERHGYRDRQQAACDRLRSYLGNMVTTQLFSVGDHPLGKYRAVIGTQPYVAGQPLDLFVSRSTVVQARQVAAFCETHPTGTVQLRDLIKQTFASDEDARLLPDLNGQDNFRVTGTDGLLRLIDAEPIDGNIHPGVRTLVLDQAEALDRFLDAA